MSAQLSVVAYINGVRFYPRSVSISATVGEVVSFQVDVPPVKQWQVLPPRSHVAIFTNDRVTGVWRMLCEGDFIGWATASLATGQRSRSLLCRGLHGWWNDQTYANIAGILNQQHSAVAQLNKVVADGKVIASPSGADPFQLFALNGLIDKFGTGFKVAGVYRQLFDLLARQLPVESYYIGARRQQDKIWVFADAEIEKVFDWSRFLDVAKNGIHMYGLPPNTTISSIFSKYEDISFYRRVPMLSPPTYGQAQGTSFGCPELLFLPQLYNTVPPACNVIFRDQIVSDQGTLNFSTMPTRIVGDAQAVPNVPKYYVASDPYSVTDPAAERNRSPAAALYHTGFSFEELQRGVIAHTEPIEQEKLGNLEKTAGATGSPSMDQYLMQIVRHLFTTRRGQVLTRSLSCTYLPYLQPGFTCVVESANGAYLGYVVSVSHALDQSGASSTQVTMTNVRELYVVEGRLRTAPLPNWMNSLFYPSKINDTYMRLFGPNAMSEPRAASVPKDQLEPGSTNGDTQYAPEEIDIDTALSSVVHVRKYDAKTGAEKSIAGLGATVADQLRASADPPAEFLKFQYRSGHSLAQHVAFHGLVVGKDANLLDASREPPPDLSPSDAETPPLYANPFGMTLTGTPETAQAPPTGAATQYGVYTLTNNGGQTLSNERQVIARMIQAAIDRGLSSDAD